MTTQPTAHDSRDKQAKQQTPINCHTKALLAFIAFNVIVTGVGLLFDQVTQALGQGVNDNYGQLVGAVLCALWCLTLLMLALVMAYLSPFHYTQITPISPTP